MQLIKLVFESLCRALIRFFDNRFIASNDVEWYRMELDKRSAETQSLRDCIIDLVKPKTTVVEIEEPEDWKPINKGKFMSWESKRRELENSSRNRAIALKREAEDALRMTAARDKTTEQLEEELGIVNG